MPQRMLGMIAGEERTWDFVFPADWHVELWRGQTATAKIKVQELFSYLLPEVRQGCASHVGL
jgi:FKBP-type peptidyl-prolyl cis-trans isomerase (trigger factor)